MEVLFISPELTLKDTVKANSFFYACKEEVENYVSEVSILKNLSQIPSIKAKLNKNVLMIIFNNCLREYEPKIIELVKFAKENEAIIWPVAINEKCRVPMSEIDIKQSYDIFEQIRCRGLNEECIETVGVIFARKIISKILPTFYNDNCLLFVSHRRVDGEEIAANFCDQLTIQASNNRNFRDITEVEVGQAAQEVIDSALSQSDILIFIHTEKSGESEWIKKELIYAVLYNIPIIWVRVDEADISKLHIKPSACPHIECKSEDFNNKNELTKLIDDVLQKSFEAIMLNYGKVYDDINTFKEFCESSKLTLIEEDKRNLIYKLVIPRMGYVYPQRSIYEYIQYFGRRCSDEDCSSMIKFLEDKRYEEHQLYDSAILLSDKVKIRQCNEDVVVDNYEDFHNSWLRYGINKKNYTNEEIVISGSFPECDEIYKQSLYSAVSIFTKELLKEGLIVTFGSHPTFQNTIFEIGKRFRPNDYQDYINMFISKHFKDKYNYQELIISATVTETDDVDNDRLKSLTKMREKMINRPTVKALICLGGVIRNGSTILQGIDEEIKIARDNNIPVFLIGSVGGRSTQLASECKKKGDWKDFNEESELINEQLALNLDYKYLAKKIIDIIKN